MTKDEALHMAIEALENVQIPIEQYFVFKQAITAIKEALAQPEQEPFGYFKPEPFGWTDCAETDEGAIALYEKPQPKEPEQGRNFCQRCGKRIGKNDWDIHTCTPPRGKE